MVSHQAFFFANGAYAETIQDLRRVLPEIDESFVNRHLSDEKNDFSLWIREIFQETKLADRLNECHTKEDVIDALDAFLLDDGYGKPPVHIVTDEYVVAKQMPERTPKERPQATVFHAEQKPVPPKPTHYDSFLTEHEKHEEHAPHEHTEHEHASAGHEHHVDGHRPHEEHKDAPPTFPRFPPHSSSHKEAHKETKTDPSAIVQRIAEQEHKRHKLSHAHKEFLFGIAIGILVTIAVFALLRALS